MQKLTKLSACFLIFIQTNYYCSAQSCSNMNLQLQSDIASACSTMVITMIHDQLGRPYLYVANKEAGLKIYNISNPAAPLLASSVPTSLYGSLDVMNLHQDGNYVYLALGNTFTNPQQGGMAIVDITNPTSPTVTDYYLVPSSTSGGGIVKVEGNYAYLGAMKSGLVILDITDKSNILSVSQFMPDINYPVASPNANLYNARGMEVKNSIVYLCFDAGGLRIINCTNKAVPVQTGRYVNPVMYSPLNHAKAYNNIVLDGSYAYIAVDYCGMEVLDISDTSNITLHGWWNPYNCPNNNWFSSPVHANEIHYDSNCKHVFLSTGKSDMMVIDIANPAQPDSCNFYGGVSNNLGTWGLGLYQNQIYLSYICASIPFSSNWTGVKILTYTPCSTSITEALSNTNFSIFPNPAQNQISFKTSTNLNNADLSIFNSFGQKIKTITKINTNQLTIDTKELLNGIYFIVLKNRNVQVSGRFIIDK